MTKINIYKPNSLYNKNGTLFAFDAFIKQSFLYLIMPLYKNYPASHNIDVFVKYGKITLHSNIIKYKDEPVHIMIYKIHSNEPSNQCAIFYNRRKFIINEQWKTYEHLYKTCDLSLTTLCKNDFPLIQPFINYYIEQGVERFYIYYNGIITSEIQEKITQISEKYTIPLNKIVFIEWNFDYWNKNSLGTAHHAQLGQMHHAIYFFGKNYSKYMTFCDLDEYLYVKKGTMKTLIQENPNTDTFAFHNLWAHDKPENTMNDVIEREFKKTFYCSNVIAKYGWRSKCIHKVSSIQTINIHHHKTYLKKRSILMKNQLMFHFYNWGQVKRKIDSIENNVIFNKITLPT
jgi:hypothetical protein